MAADLSKVWIMQASKKAKPGEKYYFNPTTKQTQWDAPEGDATVIPEGWYPFDQDGKVMYAHRDTQKVVTNVPTNSTPTANNAPANAKKNNGASAGNAGDAGASNLVKKIKGLEATVKKMANEAKKSLENVKAKTVNAAAKVGNTAAAKVSEIQKSATNIANDASKVVSAATETANVSKNIKNGKNNAAKTASPNFSTGHITQEVQKEEAWKSTSGPNPAALAPPQEKPQAGGRKRKTERRRGSRGSRKNRAQSRRRR